MSTLPITSPVDLSERDNKEALIVKKEVETNDAEVFEEVVVKVANFYRSNKKPFCSGKFKLGQRKQERRNKCQHKTQQPCKEVPKAGLVAESKDKLILAPAMRAGKPFTGRIATSINKPA